MCIALRASLTILHVFEYADAVPPETGGQLLELEIFYQAAQESLNTLLKTTQQAGVDCETIMGAGIAPSTILETIASKDIDLAILGTRALRGFERLIFGSTAEAVLRNAQCPVLTIGPQAPHSVQREFMEGPVVFATDFNPMTVHAIRYAAPLCKAIGAPLHFLHVLPRKLEGGKPQIVPPIMTEALHRVATECGTAIDPPTCAITYGSEVSNAVVEYARREKAGLIILGVRQASMLASHVPAHIAYRIITEAPCPVLTMAFVPKLQVSLAAAYA